MKKIVFVCTGNTCRSVLAEYMLRKMLSEIPGDRDGFEIISRGTAASPLYKVPEIVKKTLKKEGIGSVEHNSTQITREDYENAEMIFVMENHHKAFLEETFGKSNKISLLGGEEEIPDPIGQPEEVYTETFETIKKHLFRIKEKLNHVATKK